MERYTKSVTTASGVVKVIYAQNASDFSSATSTAQSETKPKFLDINVKSYGNKHYSELS